jgi:hypothetical protein
MGHRDIHGLLQGFAEGYLLGYVILEEGSHILSRGLQSSLELHFCFDPFFQRNRFF